MLGRTQLADLFVDRSQVRGECLKPVELGDLFGGLSKGRRIGEGFGNALAFDFAQETKLRMPGAVGLRTMARGLATTARGRRYGTGTKVAQSEKLLHQFTAGSFQISQRLGQTTPPNLSISIHSEKRRLPPFLKTFHFYVTHPRSGAPCR
jgi:hypothetical protein